VASRRFVLGREAGTQRSRGGTCAQVGEHVADRLGERSKHEPGAPGLRVAHVTEIARFGHIRAPERELDPRADILREEKWL